MNQAKYKNKHTPETQEACGFIYLLIKGSNALKAMLKAIKRSTHAVEKGTHWKTLMARVREWASVNRVT